MRVRWRGEWDVGGAMPRKLTRRERRARQELRDEAMDGGLPVREEAPVSRPDAESGISYTGAFGGLLGAGIFFFLTGAILIEEEGSRRLWSFVFGVGGLFFLPAIIVSLVPGHPRRQAVLRWATIGCLLIAALGLFAFGLGVAVILAPTTALLAIGAGLIFQGPQAKK
ncbi:MAG TPA: hypothetical protein VMR52_01480 [Dehalococcoidia bacterium]|nr:hypothetical protein [Dehalococcoidia bacterium]